MFQRTPSILMFVALLCGVGPAQADPVTITSGYASFRPVDEGSFLRLEGSGLSLAGEWYYRPPTSCGFGWTCVPGDEINLSETERDFIPYGFIDIAGRSEEFNLARLSFDILAGDVTLTTTLLSLSLHRQRPLRSLDG